MNLRRATTAFSEKKEKKPLKTYGSRASQDDSRISSSDLQMRSHLSLPSTFGTGSFHEIGAREITKEEVPNGVNGKSLAEDELWHNVQNPLQQQRAHDASAISGSPTTREKASTIGDKIPEISNGKTISLTSDETSVLHASIARTTFKHQDSSDDPVSLPNILQKPSPQGEKFPIPDPLNTKPKKRPRFLLDLPDTREADDVPALDYHNASPTKRARISKTDKSGNEVDQDDTCDELSLALSKQQPSHTTSKQSKTKRLREIDQLSDDKLGLDDVDIGLPVEKYQPRPSRSRSGRQDEELIVPVDFSKRPEAAAKGKKKNKRRKTTAFEQLLHSDEAETDIVQIKIPSPMKESEKVQDVPTINNFETTNQLQAEIDPSRDKHTAAPPKKRGRPRKQVPEIREEQENPACSESSPVKSIQTAKPNKATSKKRKAAALENDLDQTSTEEQEQEEDENLPPSPPLPSKMKSNIPQKPPPTYTPPFPPSLQKHSPVTVHVPLPVTAPSPITRSPSPIDTNNNKQPSSALQTPRKTAPAAKGPDKHSPINSGKVAYRVGLSKRARIEPLLRIVRK